MIKNCPNCEYRPFLVSFSEPDGPEGFEPLPNFAGYVKHCEQHRFTYPETARHEYGYPICCRSFERECSGGCVCHKPENKTCPDARCPIAYCDGDHSNSPESIARRVQASLFRGKAWAAKCLAAADASRAASKHMAPRMPPPKCGDCGAELITIPQPDGSLVVQLKHGCTSPNFNKPRGGFEFL